MTQTPTLRLPNNPQTDSIVMQALKALMLNDPSTGLPNTQLGFNLATLRATNPTLDLVYIQNKYLMTLGAFPAGHLEAGPQTYRRNSNRTMMGQLQIIFGYYDRWDKQPDTIDTVRANIAADLERIKSNIETNDSLSYGGQAYVISIPQIGLSPYKGEFDQQIGNMVLIRREMTLTCNLLPYDS